jgi:hypothetical protein
VVVPCAFAALALAGCSSDSDSKSGGDGGDETPTAHIDRSSYTDVGLTSDLDYSDANLWACRPGSDSNECYSSQDTTVFEADGTSHVEKFARATDPKFDCFYVYPTVDLTGTTNTTDFSDLSHVDDALISQVGRFTSLCEVYAPLYRQLALGGGTSGSVSLGGDAKLAYGDVESAFKYYMEHYNKGRKFVLMGHSQGTLMLQQLYQTLFESDAGLRSQLISALLIGGGPSVPAGQKVGGTFKTLPACSSPGETGCVIAYNSFAKEAPPPDNTVFAKAPDDTSEIVCTPPPMLANNTGRSKMAYQPRKLNTPTFVPDTPAGTLPPFDTAFAGFPGTFTGDCVKSGNLHYFQVTLDPPAGDKRTVAPYRNSLTEAIGFGLHVADYNLFLDDLVEAVRLQSVAALK